jgi:small-conductance mechanosensitive channel
VKAAQRLALHNVIESGLWIVLTLLVVFLTNRLIGQFFARLTLERKQRAALRAVARLSVQAVALLVILLVVFGKPSQLSTILGLAGAGLTLVLKDFIVSFLGWFVLMGRNGIRVGDTVEINGVRGEVIELGLLRTILLETGNWTDAGQPTGRQVSFLNSFAIQGHYFNFSTSGQWLWDELKVLIPASQNPYHHIEKIRDIVAKETEGTTRLAEQEWEGLTRRYGLRSFSAEPTVNVKPTDLGVHVVVRYVTRANERSEVRYRLSHAIVRLLQDVKDLAAAADDAARPAGAAAAMEPAPSKL